jgi:uncharacterized membrane protein YgcG
MCGSPAPARKPQWTVHVRCRESIGCSMQLHSPDTGTLLYKPVALANPCMKMSATLLMCSTMITQTIPRITFIVLVELVVRVLKERPSPCSLLIVSFPSRIMKYFVTDIFVDQKQARDLVAVLTEAKQQIDPRLSEMVRYGGGGGGGRYGGGGFRGGRGGGRGGGKSKHSFSPRSIR